jgi:two-component system sensor histidine kinase/response regulator
MNAQSSTDDPARSADFLARTRQIFNEHTVRADSRTDRLFAFFMLAQWIGGIVLALVISPRTWAGESSAIHPHVWAAIFFGGVVSALPIALGVLRPGHKLTRYAICVGQMLMSSLLIHISGGRIETHFHIFGSLAILAFYRDERLLLLASGIVLSDHLLRGAFWPQSIFGVISAPLWRALEHGWWVVFEVTFLIVSIRQQLKEQFIVAEHHAQQEMATHLVEEQVRVRTAALEASKGLYHREEQASQLIFDHSLDVICTIGEEGHFTRVSRACEKLWGYTPEELVGRAYLELVHPDDRAKSAQTADRVVAGNAATDFENRYLRKDGSVVTVVWTASWSEEAKSMFCVARDASERKRAEFELQTAKETAEAANLAKSRFLANMSHEIRTPMNGVIGMTSLLLRTALTPEQRDFTETIRLSGESLLTLINDILDFSKIEAGKLMLEILDFDLQEVVEGTVELLAESAQQKGLELSGFTSPSVPTHLRGDAGRLRQVLTNLAANGIKFTAAGEVTLSVELDSQTDTRANLVFRVRDTGIGIAPEAQRKLFQAFSQADVSTTRKFGGTGLGLAISKQLIENMGGEMGLESAPGAGSTFWFTLPLEKQSVAHRPRENGHVLRDARVLIVDDSATNLQNLQRQLAAWHVQSEVARNGGSALELLRAAAPTPSPFNVAMIDQEMPGMDGLELARAIKGDPALAAIRLVLLTAHGQQLAEEYLQGTGIAQSRSKPVRQSMLFDCLVNALAESPAIVKAVSCPALAAHEQRKERVLVAEDNAINQRVALGQLRKLGYLADAVGNGFEALEALSRAPYDIVLMDCHMPELDGYDATEAIRQREGSRKHTWIIAMTANAMSGDREQCIAAGMDDYVGKPVRLDDLAAVLERASRHLALTPAIDPRSLNELRRLPDEEGQSMLRNLLSQFIEDAPAAVTAMNAGLERADAHAVALAAHNLRGSSSNFGAHRLQDLCGEMEHAGKAGDIDPLPNLLARTETELKRVLVALRRELESQLL